MLERDDDPRDQEMIKQGIDWYENNYENERNKIILEWYQAYYEKMEN